MQPKIIPFTQEGYDEKKREFEELTSRRKIAVQELQRARELGDLSENGAYKAARAEVSSIDSRLRRLTYMIRLGRVVKKFDVDFVAIGSTVKVHDGSKEMIYQVVGDFEANPTQRKLSAKSPIGRALIGKRIGDSIEIQVPAGKIHYKIISIES